MSALLIAFILKHFVCDFLLQTRWQSSHKVTYGHPGGMVHAAIHMAGSLLICVTFGLPLWLAVVDAAAHYHIDWSKMQLNKRFGLGPQMPGFWVLLGLDQALHYLTYAWMISFA